MSVQEATLTQYSTEFEGISASFWDDRLVGVAISDTFLIDGEEVIGADRRVEQQIDAVGVHKSGPFLRIICDDLELIILAELEGQSSTSPSGFRPRVRSIVHIRLTAGSST